MISLKYHGALLCDAWNNYIFYIFIEGNNYILLFSTIIYHNKENRYIEKFKVTVDVKYESTVSHDK